MNAVELLNELAEMQVSDLQAKSRDELRKTLRILKTGDSARISKLKKAELVAEISETVAEHKETIAKAEAFDRMVPELSEDELENLDQYVTKVEFEDNTGIATMAEDVYHTFRAECQKLYDSETGVWGAYSVALADLAHQTAARIEARGHSSITLLNYRTDLLNHLQTFLEREKDQFFFPQMWRYLTGHDYSERHRKARGKGNDCLDCFTKSLYKIWQFTHSAAKKEVERTNLEVKETTQTYIDITKLLQWAQKVLEDLELTSTDRKLWRPVSVALALATGRRQVEIHSTGKFTLVDEYHLSFEGQAKTRGKAWETYQSDPSYVIPTLVKAELVIKGHTWLRAMSGKYYPTEKQVNDNVNRDVNAFLKYMAKELVTGYDQDGNEIAPEDLGGKFKYHDLREVYALASFVCEGSKKYKRSMAHKWVTEVLGEDRGNVGAISTAMRYLDQYELTENSLTRI